MYMIGCLTNKELEKNTHLNYLIEKGWNLSKINSNAYHENLDAIVLLEDTMPETCCWLIELKKQTTVPIYLISEIYDSHSNIVYLQLGVEACFSMNMEVEELYYTLVNLITHFSSQENDYTKVLSNSLEVANIKLLARNLSVIIDEDIEISLTKKEYQALELLYNNPSQTVTYEEFIEKLWASKKNSKSKKYRVANLMFHLRNKIESSTTNPCFIKTVRSKGYMLDLK